MKPLPERLNDEIDRQLAVWQSADESADLPPVAYQPPTSDPQVAELAILAWQLQSARELQVDPNFARRLEDRMLAQNAALHRDRPARQWWFWRRPLRASLGLRVALSLCLLLVLLSGGVLVAAAQVANPDNPLYAIKRWEQQVRVSLAGSAMDRAELDLQLARDQLNNLANLGDAAHAQAYRQALREFSRQFDTAAQSINALPSGPDRSRLSSDLTVLRAEARRTLRGLLVRLALPERLVTTDELAHLGDSVPHLDQVQVTLPSRPNGQAVISISGEGFQSGAQLLIDGRPVAATGSLHNGLYLFTVNWTGNQHPHTIGIVNPDGTAAQTTRLILKTSNDKGGNGNSNGSGGNSDDNGNGRSGGRDGGSSGGMKLVPGKYVQAG